MLGLRLHEPAVTLSDLALAVETSTFAIGLARYGRGSPRTDRSWGLQRWFVGYFASSAVASLAGAATHGLSESKEDPQRLRFWRASLVSIGVTSLCAWHLGASLSLPASTARALLLPVYVVHLAYLVVVVRTHPSFRLALALYAPSTFFLRLALISRLRADGERGPVTMALAALSVSTAAGIVQVSRRGLHPRRFDHNATFRVIQGFAITILYAAARGLIKTPSDERR